MFLAFSVRKLMEHSSFHLGLQDQSSKSSILLHEIQAISLYLHAVASPPRIAQSSPVDMKEEGSFQYFSWKSYEGSSPHLVELISITLELNCSI